MLTTPIKCLILEENSRQQGKFIPDIGMNDYLNKLDTIAEIVSISTQEYCKGFIAFYCNDVDSKEAFITLMAVDPRARRQGIASKLMKFVCSVIKNRGFKSCFLEVRMDNHGACNFYLSEGFYIDGNSNEKYLMKINF